MTESDNRSDDYKNCNIAHFRFQNEVAWDRSVPPDAAFSCRVSDISREDFISEMIKEIQKYCTIYGEDIAGASSWVLRRFIEIANLNVIILVQ